MAGIAAKAVNVPPVASEFECLQSVSVCMPHIIYRIAIPCLPLRHRRSLQQLLAHAHLGNKAIVVPLQAYSISSPSPSLGPSLYMSGDAIVIVAAMAGTLSQSQKSLAYKASSQTPIIPYPLLPTRAVVLCRLDDHQSFLSRLDVPLYLSLSTPLTQSPLPSTSRQTACYRQHKADLPR
jgi:hypothetical protein